MAQVPSAPEVGQGSDDQAPFAVAQLFCAALALNSLPRKSSQKS